METLRSSLIKIAAELTRFKYYDAPDKDDRLSEMAIKLWDLADDVGQRDSVLLQRTARLQVLRESMSEVEWRDFCYNRQDAKDWFDKDCVPR